MHHLEEKAWLQEAHGGGEAELHDGMQQLSTRFLTHTIAGEQSLSISQHCRPAGAQVAIIPCIWLLCLLHDTKN